MPTYPLGPINTLAADMIVHRGWAQKTEVAPDGRVCLTGALKLCAPVPGDWLLARAVYRARGHAAGWNDSRGRTAGEVIAYLRTAEITDADLLATLGPQWESMVELVRRAAVLTCKDATRLDAAWDAACDAACDAAWDAACDAAWDAACDDARGAAFDAARGAVFDAARGAVFDAARDDARDAACDAARDAACGAACDAARDAALALVVRDLIGQHGFTQEHYDLLTRPWAQAIGSVHPDDKPVTA